MTMPGLYQTPDVATPKRGVNPRSLRARTTRAQALLTQHSPTGQPLQPPQMPLPPMGVGMGSVTPGGPTGYDQFSGGQQGAQDLAPGFAAPPGFAEGGEVDFSGSDTPPGWDDQAWQEYLARQNAGDVPTPAPVIAPQNMPVGGQPQGAPQEVNQPSVPFDPSLVAHFVDQQGAPVSIGPTTPEMERLAAMQQAMQNLGGGALGKIEQQSRIADIPYADQAKNFVQGAVATGLNTALQMGSPAGSPYIGPNAAQRSQAADVGGSLAGGLVPTNVRDAGLTLLPFAGEARNALEAQALKGFEFRPQAPQALNTVEQLASRGVGVPAGAAMTPEQAIAALKAGGYSDAEIAQFTANNAPRGVGQAFNVNANAEREAQAGAARNSYGTSLERSGDPGQAAKDAREAAALEGQYQREQQTATTPLEKLVADLNASGAQQTGQVVRVAVNPDAVTPLDPNSLMGSRGAVELTDPAGARVLAPGEQPGPGEVLMHHGTGEAGVQGELRPGTNLTPDPKDAQVFARTASRLEGGGAQPTSLGDVGRPVAPEVTPPPPPSSDIGTQITQALNEPTAFPRGGAMTPSEIPRAQAWEAQQNAETANAIRNVPDAHLIDLAEQHGIKTEIAPLKDGQLDPAYREKLVQDLTDKVRGDITDVYPTPSEATIGQQMTQAQQGVDREINDRLNQVFGPSAPNGRVPAGVVNAEGVNLTGPQAGAAIPTPAERAGATGLTGEARIQAMNDYGNTPQSRSLSTTQQQFINSQNGINSQAERATGGVGGAGMPPGATPGTTGGGTLPPSGTAATGASAAKPQNPLQQTINVISAPTQMKLLGGHFARQGEGAAVTHLKEAADAFRAGFRAFTAPGQANKIVQDIAARSSALPEGMRLSDVRGVAGQRLQPGLGDRFLSSIPGFDRVRGFGTTYLNTLRDGMYVTTAERHLRMDPDAPASAVKAIYNVLSHETGHPTFKGAIREGLGNVQGLGIGWNALAARVQHFGDILMAPGNPLPWSPTARGEAIRGMLGNIGTMATSTMAASALGAKVNVPFLGDNRSLTNPYGIRTDFFKPVTMTPDKAFKTVYGTGGSGYDTILRFMGNTALDLINGDKEGLIQHLEAWGRAETGVVPSLLIDLASGQTWNGKSYDLNSLKEEASHGFLERLAPIAAESLWHSYNAWGPQGLLRAAPSLGAWEAQTTPTTRTDIRGAVMNDSHLPQILQGQDFNALGPRGRETVDNLIKANYGPAFDAATKTAKDSQDKAFTDHQAATDKIKAEAEQRKADLYTNLQSGKMDGATVKTGREMVDKAASAKYDAAQKDPAYVKATSDFQQSEVQKALNVYHAIPEKFKGADGKIDFGAAKAKQDEFIKYVGERDRPTANLLLYELQTPKNDVVPLDRLYQVAQPTISHYFGEIKDPGVRTTALIANPKDDALLVLLGYERATRTPQAQTILDHLRTTMPSVGVR